MLKKVFIVVIIAISLYFINDYMDGCDYYTDARFDNKVVIVTGANTGIGKETVIDLVKRGAKVYMGCRSLDRGQEALDDILSETGVSKDLLVLMKLDLASMASVRQFAKEFKTREKNLHVLINNAGVMFLPYSKTVDGFEVTFGTNHLGHFLLTSLLSEMLVSSAPSRVVTVSSLANTFSMGINFDNLKSMTEDEYSMMEAYPHSKLANILMARELAKRLGDKGVTSVSLHPGSVESELVRHVPYLSKIPYMREVFYFVMAPFFKDTWHGARTSIYCALDKEVEQNNGKYFSDCAVSTPHVDGENDDIARRLWEVSVDFVQLKPTETHPALLT